MKTQTTPRPGSHRPRISSLTRIAAFIGLVALIGIPLFSSSLASSTSEYSRALSIPRLVSSDGAAVKSNGIFGNFLNVGRQPALQPFSPVLAETIATFAADCTTPKSEFLLGETVCAQTDGVNLGYPGGRWVHWLRQDLSIAHGGSGTTNITTNPQNFSFVPDQVGTWKVTIAETGDDSQTPADFTVSSSPLATFNGACTTTQSSYALGDVVCARVTGVDPGLNRRLFWIDPAGNLRDQTAITTDPQTDLFTLPTADTEVIGDTVVDNRGTWKVNIVSSRGSAVYSVTFNVTGATPRADVGVAKAIIGASPDAGAQFSFFVSVTNYGPNDAVNVVFTDPQPINTTFVSITQTSGPTSPGFNCDGNNPVVCTRATLASGATAEFELVYTAGSSGSITNIATVDSDTYDPNTDNNTGSYGPFPINGDGGDDNTCSLDCPNDIAVTATSASGAVVNFSGDIGVGGTCGTVNSSPASGSQFPVGTTLVTVTSSEGGGSCTFNVTVINRPAPDIQCPLPTLTGEADPGETETTVNVPTPSATGENLTVTGVRNDNRAISDPYPVGTTVINWTATDNNGTETASDDRTDSCNQTVNVTSPPGDAPTITCPSNKTFTSADCSGYSPTASEIGTPTTTGSGVTVESERSDGQPLLDTYPVGNTSITWTATDNVGRVVSCTQLITVNSTGDSTPPTLNVPDNVSATTNSCTATLDDELGVATAEDSCSEVTISRSGVPTFSCPTPGNPGRQCESFVFPTGTTVITYTATDGSGNSTTGTQNVTVTEDPAIPPTVDAPANVTLYTGPGATSCSVTVADLDTTLGTATANDNCPGVTVARTDAPAGNIFPLGNTTVTYTATDRSGNTANDQQVVTVVDNTAPVISCPADINSGTDPGVCSATLNPGTATATDNCDSNPTITGTRSDNQPLNAPYPKGTTTITWTATDHATPTANESSCTQTITVVDDEAPVISCPANINTGTDPGVCSATLNPGTATATDNCDSNPTITGTRSDNQPLNAPYPRGTTTITWTATDHATPTANSSSCAQTITVVDDEAPVITTNGLTPVLFPANHAYHTFNVTDFVIGVSDNCDALGVSDVVIQKVTSDEVENGDGDGDTFNDMVIAADCKSVQVRAERRNSGDGRVYTITFKVTDTTGNVGTKTSTIHVPKNLGVPVVDSGPNYTVTGTCP